MTLQSTDVAATDLRDTIALALRLALGSTRAEDATADWALAFDVASRELLAPLAWKRSGALIRDHATADVVVRWRRAALAAQLRGERQLDLLHRVVDALEAAGVTAVVLKGLPLGDRLYDDAFVRSSADIDLFVAAPQRREAARVVNALGWQRIDGGPPWHEAWSLTADEGEHHLELHSSLVSDHLGHLTVPLPTAEFVDVGGRPVRAHAGDFLAPYLAVHLATHQLPPLLWLIDFATLWRELPIEARARAELAARRAGIGRYLAWARERAGLVERAAGGDGIALTALGVHASGRRDVHSIWRHVALAASVPDRAHVIAAFLVPRRARGTLWSLASYTVARLRTRLMTLAGVSRQYRDELPRMDTGIHTGVPNGARPLRLDREEMTSFTREIITAGGALWVRAPGGSMIPAIPRGALVRIGPVPKDGIVRGDIVLALTSDGEPVLHRVLRVLDDRLVMRGDAAIHTDPAVPFSRIIGVASHVRDGDVERELPRRPLRSMSVSALKIRRRIARVLGRVG